MNTHHIIYIVSLSLTSLTTICLGFIVLIKGRKSKSNILYALFSFAIGIWTALQAYVAFIPEGNLDTALLFGRLFHLPLLFIPCLLLHFVHLFLEGEETNRKSFILYYALCFVFLLVLPFKMIVTTMKWTPYIGYQIMVGWAYPLSCAYFVILVGLSLFKLYRGYKKETGHRRNQIKYLFWSTLIGFCAGWTNYFYAYDHPIFFINPYAQFGVPLYVLTITYAIFRYRLMDINLIVKKTVIYGTIYSISLGVFVAIVISLNQWFISGNVEYKVILLSLIPVLIIVSMVKPLDKILTALTDRFLFRQKYEYHQTLRDASLKMIRIRRLDTLLNLIVNILTKQVRVRHATIFLWDKENSNYVVKASRGKLKVPRNYLKIPQNNPLVKYLLKTKNPVVSEELRLMPKQGSAALTMVIDEMERLNVIVCVPNFLKGKLIGFLLLGEKLSGDIYSQEDLSLFNTLSIQAALAIENAQAYEEVTRAKDKLVEAEKLASIGRLAGGIAHEIKNPLASIKTFTEYLNKKFEDPEFRTKFQRIVGSEVDRINHIVEQLVTYAHPKPASPQEIDLNKVIEETLALLENDLKKRNIIITKHLSAAASRLISDPEQLKQVFLNLFLNSIQAMENKKTVQKELSITTEKHNGTIKIKISDTGEGIPADKLPLIFDPFFTTKQKGCGLGLSIVKSIIESQKGEISVKSDLGKGTSFWINLPA